MRLRSRNLLPWLWLGVVVSLGMLASPASAASHRDRRLTIFDIHIESLRYQLRALETRVNAAATSGTPQVQARAAWASNLRDVRAAFAQLQTEVTKFQTRNRTANLAIGLKVTEGLQAALSRLGQAIEGFALAADAAKAKTALAGISTGLNGFINSTADVPDCCLLTCCAIR
jgi:hypothetical protein